MLDVDASNGTLTLNADGSFTYLPDFGFIGDDTFTYVANDGFVDSAAATVTISVTDPAGTPPRLYPFNEQIVAADSYRGPNFTFRHIDGIEWYQIWIGTDTSQPSPVQFLFEWYPTTDASAFANPSDGICDTQTNICTIPTDIWLANGDYSWWITYWEPEDTQADIDAAWNETTFSFDFAVPPATVTYINSADAAMLTSAPDLISWEHDVNIQWYQLWVGTADDSTQVYFEWIDARSICDPITCDLDVSGLAFPGGGYEIWTEAWGPGGYLTWTQVNEGEPSTFTVDSAMNMVPRPQR